MTDVQATSIPVELLVDPAARAALDRIAPIDFRAGLALAAASGRSPATMIREMASLRFGPGRLTSNEYYYYRLWEPGRTDTERRRFVGKVAPSPMHVACNQPEWKALASDKLAFHALMRGAGFPVPGLHAVGHQVRSLPGVRSLRSTASTAAFLRDPAIYPLFAKPIDGQYSLGVISADRCDAGRDLLLLRGRRQEADIPGIAAAIAAHPGGFLLQERLEPATGLADAFGDQLWSVRLLVLLTPEGAIIHRATAKVPVGDNPADNFWRPGNLLAALDRDTGGLDRVIRGTGEALEVLTTHPDTGASFRGTVIPQWSRMTDLVREAAGLLPGIGTQSWDIAVAAAGPVILEVNYGGDLNLSQLASGQGTLDDVYLAHLRRHGYRARPP